MCTNRAGQHITALGNTCLSHDGGNFGHVPFQPPLCSIHTHARTPTHIARREILLRLGKNGDGKVATTAASMPRVAKSGHSVVAALSAAPVITADTQTMVDKV